MVSSLLSAPARRSAGAARVRVAGIAGDANGGGAADAFASSSAVVPGGGTTARRDTPTAADRAISATVSGSAPARRLASSTAASSVLPSRLREYTCVSRAVPFPGSGSGTAPSPVTAAPGLAPWCANTASVWEAASANAALVAEEVMNDAADQKDEVAFGL